MHILVCGTTGSGKSVLANWMVADYEKKKYAVIVYDPYYNSESDRVKMQWSKGCVVVNNEEDFLRIFRASQGCVVVIDEASMSIGQHNRAMIETATQGRHYGHRCMYVTQRVTQLSPNVRDNCSELFLFHSSPKDCKIHAEDWCEEELLKANMLQVGEHYHKSRMQKVVFNKLKLRN